ncbi:hypothetical protein AH67_01245 [Bifidobacterium pseudolongum PV8-2]|uniref:Uncharacterized protein n=1 Tax=Bifidobacterium pseudolongum PV8-2 TaxID=1447715 RepID=A0A0A7I6M8_9BIFI|nr:hypothetical protein AH67_01245 [Bifidobacterium pseudolongum PV8-2]
MPSGSGCRLRRPPWRSPRGSHSSGPRSGRWTPRPPDPRRPQPNRRPARRRVRRCISPPRSPCRFPW